jgi:hypothetical protein
MTYTKELAAFREAKAAMHRWDANGGFGPALEVTAAEDRLVQAAWALAEAVDVAEGGDPR